LRAWLWPVFSFSGCKVSLSRRDAAADAALVIPVRAARAEAAAASVARTVSEWIAGSALRRKDRVGALTRGAALLRKDRVVVRMKA
jgi:ApbE superfamily uncharacterized protein (UPF0280 family)